MKTRENLLDDATITEIINRLENETSSFFCQIAAELLKKHNLENAQQTVSYIEYVALINALSNNLLYSKVKDLINKDPGFKTKYNIAVQAQTLYHGLANNVNEYVKKPVLRTKEIKPHHIDMDLPKHVEVINKVDQISNKLSNECNILGTMSNTLAIVIHQHKAQNNQCYNAQKLKSDIMSNAILPAYVKKITENLLVIKDNTAKWWQYKHQERMDLIGTKKNELATIGMNSPDFTLLIKFINEVLLFSLNKGLTFSTFFYGNNTDVIIKKFCDRLKENLKFTEDNARNLTEETIFDLVAEERGDYMRHRQKKMFYSPRFLKASRQFFVDHLNEFSSKNKCYDVINGLPKCTSYNDHHHEQHSNLNSVNSFFRISYEPKTEIKNARNKVFPLK